MNVLTLTPDHVGSTLLQRLVSVYAHANTSPSNFTINLDELTDGLISYHNDTYIQIVLGKKENSWNYHQSLQTLQYRYLPQTVAY